MSYSFNFPIFNQATPTRSDMPWGPQSFYPVRNRVLSSETGATYLHLVSNLTSCGAIPPLTPDVRMAYYLTLGITTFSF